MKRTDISMKDVFISWTGKDRELKDIIIQHLNSNGISCLESDESCSGDYREWSKEAVGNKYRLNEARDGYIVETLYAKDDVIELPEMFNSLPVVELGNMSFTWCTEAWKAIIPASVKKRGISRSMLAMRWVMQNTEAL